MDAEIIYDESSTRMLLLEVPSDIMVFTKNPGGEQIFYTVLGLDSLEGRLTPICDPAPGTQFTIGETIVSCHITSSLGEELSKSFKVIINLQ